MASGQSQRPQSSIEFNRRQSREGNNMGLHINPKRARTPNLGPQAPIVMPTEIETPIREKDLANGIKDIPNFNNSTEHTPLIPKNGSTEPFSHSGSMERIVLPKTRDIPKLVLEQLAIRPFRLRPFLENVKVFILITITITCCILLATSEEVEHDMKLVSLPSDQSVILHSWPYKSRTPIVRVFLVGPFSSNESDHSGHQLTVGLNTGTKDHITINETALSLGENINLVKEYTCSEDFDLCQLNVSTSLGIPLSWNAMLLSWQMKYEVYYAFIILGCVYILIIFELVHRTLAAMLGALAALAVLSYLEERPTLEEIISWMEMETLTLLFGMMILVSIFSETGFFDFSALKAYKLARGKVWPLVTLLCVFSAVVSAFLDNVTTILLMAPVTIRLCEVLNLDPRRILIAEVLFSNIGGTATAIGDPPNVIIVGALSNRGIDFSTFTLHMFPGIVFVSFAGYGLLRIYYRNMDKLKNKSPPEIAELNNEIAMWRRYASRIQVVTREEYLMRALLLEKAAQTEIKMNQRLHQVQRKEEQDMSKTVRRLEQQYCIKDNGLLVKSGIVLFIVIVILFIYSFIDELHLNIGWIAVLGAIWLLVLANIVEMESILHKVEWSTLLFFAGLFILIEALAELGMIKTIGDGISQVITSVDEGNRLLLALVVILWVSAISSSFIDNIPYTTAMVPVLVQIHEELHLPLLPLVVALAFGACLGGNGTLIGASANVVCAGIAEKHGCGFTFVEFFKIGFPMMLLTTLVSGGYVLICHVAMDWNYT